MWGYGDVQDHGEILTCDYWEEYVLTWFKETESKGIPNSKLSTLFEWFL